MANRVFQDLDPMTIKQPAPLAIGLYGYGGAGKTESALRIATGIARVYNCEVVFVDTENRKGLTYRDLFAFRYVPFDPPHNALDYAALIEQFAQRQCVLVIDQVTEEHEGDGGLLDTHEKEKGGNERRTAVAWGVAKRQHQKLARALRRALASIPIVATWRAQDKTDWTHKDENGKTAPLPIGEMPIGSKDLPFEMTAHYLLRPGAHGVPCLKPETRGEHIMTKDPRWFQDIVKPGEAFSEAHGEAFARWAMRGATPTKKANGAAFASAEKAIKALDSDEAGIALAAQIEGSQKLTDDEKAALASVLEKRRKALRGEVEP